MAESCLRWRWEAGKYGRLREVCDFDAFSKTGSACSHKSNGNRSPHQKCQCITANSMRTIKKSVDKNQ